MKLYQLVFSGSINYFSITPNRSIEAPCANQVKTAASSATKSTYYPPGGRLFGGDVTHTRSCST